MYEQIVNNILELILIENEKGDVVFTNRKIDKDLIKLSNDNKNELYFSQENKWYLITRKKLQVENEKLTLKCFLDITLYKEQQKMLEKESYTDALTSIYNRNAIEKYLFNLMEGYYYSKNNFIVVMADIDNFKLVNTEFGHDNGDKVLMKVASLLNENIRSKDFLGRYGGEEFLLILRTSNVDVAYKKLDHLRKIIEDNVFEINGNKVPITLTFGYSIYDGTKPIDEVIKEADIALYIGKDHGRNIVKMYKKND